MPLKLFTVDKPKSRVPTAGAESELMGLHTRPDRPPIYLRVEASSHALQGSSKEQEIHTHSCTNDSTEGYNCALLVTIDDPAS